MLTPHKLRFIYWLTLAAYRLNSLLLAETSMFNLRPIF